MKNLIVRLVRWLSGWAWADERELRRGLLAVKDVVEREGQFDVFLELHPGVAEFVALCFARLVNGAPNYRELRMSGAHFSDRRIVVTVQRVDGLTPGEKCEKMERERDAAVEGMRTILRENAMRATNNCIRWNGWLPSFVMNHGEMATHLLQRVWWHMRGFNLDGKSRDQAHGAAPGTEPGIQRDECLLNWNNLDRCVSAWAESGCVERPLPGVSYPSFDWREL